MKSQRKMKMSEKSVMKSKKAIPDTNLWLSFLITKNHTDIDILILEGKIQLIFLCELIKEFITVTARLKFKKFFCNSDIEKLLRFIFTYSFAKAKKLNSIISKKHDNLNTL